MNNKRFITSTLINTVGFFGLIVGAALFVVFFGITMFAGPGEDGLFHLGIALVPVLGFASLLFVGIKRSRRDMDGSAGYGCIVALGVILLIYILLRLVPNGVI